MKNITSDTAGYQKLLKEIMGEKFPQDKHLLPEKAIAKRMKQLIVQYSGNQSQHPKRDTKIFFDHHGLNGRKRKTIKQIHNLSEYNLSKSRIGQIIRRIKKYLLELNALGKLNKFFVNSDK